METMEIISVILIIWALLGNFVMIISIETEDIVSNSDFTHMVMKYTGPFGLLSMVVVLSVARLPKYIRWKFRK